MFSWSRLQRSLAQQRQLCEMFATIPCWRQQKKKKISSVAFVSGVTSQDTIIIPYPMRVPDSSFAQFPGSWQSWSLSLAGIPAIPQSRNPAMTVRRMLNATQTSDSRQLIGYAILLQLHMWSRFPRSYLRRSGWPSVRNASLKLCLQIRFTWCRAIQREGETKKKKTEVMQELQMKVFVLILFTNRCKSDRWSRELIDSHKDLNSMWFSYLTER
jgi:hypothetical protein